MRHGKRVIDHGRYQFDFRNKKVRDFAEGVVDRVVNEYGVGYIKFDYNIDAGLGTEVNADSFGDGLLGHNRSYLEWLDKIKAKYPSLIIENCASGGMRMDYAMLTRGHLQSTSDQTNYKKTAVIASNAATAVLPEQAAVWSYPTAEGDENEATYNMVNAMLGRIHLSGDVLNLSNERLEDIKQGLAVYKNLRHKIPEFIPFYPLGLNGFNKGWAVAGYKTDKEKHFAVWRLNDDENTLAVPVSDVKTAEVLYPQNKNGSIKVCNDHLAVTLNAKYSAVVLKITDI